MKPTLRRAAVACGLAALAALWTSAGRAHGGPPLRLAPAEAPEAVALARLVVFHLRDGVGYAVVWSAPSAESSVRRALAGGQADIAVGHPAAAVAHGEPAAAPCTEEARLRATEGFAARYGAEVFLTPAAPGADPCAAPGIAVSRRVLEDLRFGILRREMRALAAAVTGADLDAVREAEARGGERAAATAARSVLAGKRLW